VSRSPFDAKRIPRGEERVRAASRTDRGRITKIVNEIRKPTRPPQNGKRGGQRPLKQDDSADFAAFSRTRRRRPGRSLELGVGAYREKPHPIHPSEDEEAFLRADLSMLLPLLDDLAERKQARSQAGLFSKVDK